jgi:hypothetical protein
MSWKNMFCRPLPVLAMRQRKSGLLEMIGSAAFPDRAAVFVESELVEDEIAGETARGAGIGGEHLDAAGLAADGDADLEPHIVELQIFAEISASMTTPILWQTSWP